MENAGNFKILLLIILYLYRAIYTITNIKVYDFSKNKRIIYYFLFFIIFFLLFHLLITSIYKLMFNLIII